MIFIPIFREITSCFRHLEKPIKTKEHKIKHFVFICFYWFYPVFLDGESKLPRNHHPTPKLQVAKLLKKRDKSKSFLRKVMKSRVLPH